jgi:hypothetical protein
VLDSRGVQIVPDKYGTPKEYKYYPRNIWDGGAETFTPDQIIDLIAYVDHDMPRYGRSFYE